MMLQFEFGRFPTSSSRYCFPIEKKNACPNSTESVFYTHTVQEQNMPSCDWAPTRKHRGFIKAVVIEKHEPRMAGTLIHLEPLFQPFDIQHTR